MPPLSRTHTDTAFVVAIIYSRKTDKKLSYRFRDKPDVCLKSPILTPQPAFGAPVGATPVEFRRHHWRQKTRVSRLSCGVVCVILCLAVLVELRLVADRQTDRHRPMASTAHA